MPLYIHSSSSESKVLSSQIHSLGCSYKKDLGLKVDFGGLLRVTFF